jgi:sugar phosphate permease
MMLARKMRSIHYGWIVAASAFLALLIAAGVRATPGVLLIPLSTDTHWSRATISFAVAINLTLYGLMGPFAGALIARFGLRATTALGLAIVALGVGATSLVREPWELIVLWGVVVGCGSGMVAIVLAAAVATRWFVARRGLVSGVLTASTATGQLVFLPLLASVATSSGWRSVTLVVAACALAAIVPVVLLMRDRPEDIGLAPFGANPGERGSDAPLLRAGIDPIRLAFSTLARCARSRDFWLLSGTFFVCGASTNGLIGTHFIPACGDHGIPEVRAAGLLAAMGVLDLIGTSASGWLTDRADSRVLLFWYYGLRGLSLLFLPFAFGLALPGLSAFAIFYGLDWIATIPPTLKLTTEIFGSEDAPIAYGWVAAAHQLGAGAIAFVAGDLRELFANYGPAFELSGALCLGAAAAVLLIGRTGPGAIAQPGA